MLGSDIGGRDTEPMTIQEFLAFMEKHWDVEIRDEVKRKVIEEVERRKIVVDCCFDERG